jgi:hypothetical protein
MNVKASKGQEAFKAQIWKKGVSGNPGGRPKNEVIRAVKEFALKLSVPALEYLAKVMNNEEEKTHHRMSAASMILDRGLGKPDQAVQIDNSPIDVTPNNLTGEELGKRICELEQRALEIKSGHALEKVIDGEVTEVVKGGQDGKRE